MGNKTLETSTNPAILGATDEITKSLSMALFLIQNIGAKINQLPRAPNLTPFNHIKTNIPPINTKTTSIFTKRLYATLMEDPKTAKKQYWLLKTEPNEWSWEDQKSNNGKSKWDGVKNKQAQKYLKSMKLNDFCFFYHSGVKSPRVVGVVEVVKEWYEDGDGDGIAVDVAAVGEMRRVVELGVMKKDHVLGKVGFGFGLFRQPRLSVVVVDEGVWDRVCELGGGFDGDGRGVDEDGGGSDGGEE